MQGNKELFRLLGEIDPQKPYGTALFDALAKLTVSVAVEAVCVRQHFQLFDPEELWDPAFEVYMVQRSPNDTAYPGEWHCPGSVMRPGESVKDIMDRLNKKEFDGNLLSSKFVANINHTHEQRGHFLSMVYLCQLKDKKGIKNTQGLNGKWYLTYRLPERTVIHHRNPIIPAALGSFLSDRTY
jgi:ADP-ribose pyrophosphatase YjhB (NUDIX family)